MFNEFSRLSFPDAPVDRISVRLLQAILDSAETERITVGVVGITASGMPIGRIALSRTSLKSFPTDVGASLYGFASLAIADFEAHTKKGQELDAWEPPFSAIEALPAEAAEGDTPTDALANILAWHSAFFARSITEELDERPVVPRSNEESRFIGQVKAIAIERKPGLINAFRKSFSLSSARLGTTEIDFCGSNYLTCYTAINPKSRRPLRGAEAALWRIARARDSLGFVVPETCELTAWVPPAGLPVYSESEYQKASDEVTELGFQARKEEISVRSVHDAQSAATHLLQAEGA